MKCLLRAEIFTLITVRLHVRIHEFCIQCFNQLQTENCIFKCISFENEQSLRYCSANSMVKQLFAGTDIVLSTALLLH